MPLWFQSALSLCCMVFLCSCASVQSTVARVSPDYNALPTETVTQATTYIEQEVKSGNREPALDTFEGFILDTLEIRQALRSRAARSELIQGILDQGNAWEKSNGKISILRTSDYRKSTTSKQRDRDALFIIMENRDRVIIYDSITDANNLNPAARSAVESLFQQARVAQLDPGQLYEDNAGNQSAK